MKLPKECYELFDRLFEKNKKEPMGFLNMLSALKEEGYWVEIDWNKLSDSKQKEFVTTPVLIVSMEQETIEKTFYTKKVSEFQQLVDDKHGILISASVARRWEYHLKEEKVA